MVENSDATESETAHTSDAEEFAELRRTLERLAGNKDLVDAMRLIANQSVSFAASQWATSGLAYLYSHLSLIHI